MSDDKQKHQESLKRAEEILESLDIQMRVVSCGCCEGACVEMVYKGDTILEGNGWDHITTSKFKK